VFVRFVALLPQRGLLQQNQWVGKTESVFEDSFFLK